MDAQPPDYAGRRVTVMGLGRFGGGLGAVRFLIEQGARVTISDRADATVLRDSLDQLRGLELDGMRLGEHRPEDFLGRDLVVASPAIRPDHPCLNLARDAGIPVTTEVGLFVRHCPAPIIGVTGTVGKSTTAALIHHFLSFLDAKSWLGGNLGGSLLASLPKMSPRDWVVLELSSFQLLYLDAECWSPRIAVVTNFFPNHLDWHRDIAEYRYAKQTLLRWQQSTSDIVVLDGSDPALADWADTPPAWLIDARTVSILPVITSVNIPIRNVRLAIGAARAAGADLDSAGAEILRGFRSLPHRMEVLGEKSGRVFINDSKATTPEAAISALRTLEHPVILLAGGSDKGVDLSAFADEIAQRTKCAALMGDTASRLSELLSTRGNHSTRVCADFPEAFRWAFDQSSPGDIILLSPGCASFGWFRDFENRGEQFRRAWEQLS
jgi:UDP-N-acetylmuramoylalanine--D-glutamate ligase